MMNSEGIVLKGSRRTEVVTEAVAAPTGTQVLVRTHAVGLCGSDLGLFHGTYEGPRNYPLYFGHEWSGVVQDVGSDVTRVRPGDNVTGDCSLYCGVCELCARDRNLCRAIEKFGITVSGASRQLFLQEERYVYPTHADANLDLVALSEPLAVGAHAVRRVRESRPDFDREKILVLGGGTIGLSCFFALKVLEGCRHVELFDIVEARRQKALDLGASELTDVMVTGHDAEDYGDLYSGQGYDVIFETSGAPPAFHRAVELLRPLGTIMALGFLPSVEFSVKQITLKAAHIMGSIGGTGDFERVLAFAHQHPHLAAELISHRVPFQEYGTAFELAQNRKQAMKVLITFD
jgi:threonine dehydrogenase-like Zn-dependent dehydrogenase